MDENMRVINYSGMWVIGSDAKGYSVYRGALDDMFLQVNGLRTIDEAKTCENYGQRVQKSVFECLVDPAQWTALRQKLIDEIKQDEDSLRFYFLGKNWKIHVEHVGVKTAYEQESPIII